jgi:hypothetical protein
MTVTMMEIFTARTCLELDRPSNRFAVFHFKITDFRSYCDQLEGHTHGEVVENSTYYMANVMTGLAELLEPKISGTIKDLDLGVTSSRVERSFMSDFAI